LPKEFWVKELFEPTHKKHTRKPEKLPLSYLPKELWEKGNFGLSH